MTAAGRVLLVAAVVVPVILWIAAELYDWIDHRRHPPFGDAFEELDRPITLMIVLFLGVVLAVLGGLLFLVESLL